MALVVTATLLAQGISAGVDEKPADDGTAHSGATPAAAKQVDGRLLTFNCICFAYSRQPECMARMPGLHEDLNSGVLDTHAFAKKICNIEYSVKVSYRDAKELEKRGNHTLLVGLLAAMVKVEYEEQLKCCPRSDKTYRFPVAIEQRLYEKLVGSG